VSANWLFAAGSVSCYPPSMANLSCSLVKNVYCISTKQHGGIKSGVLQFKTQPFRKRCDASALSCWMVKLSAQVCESDRFGLFVATMVKL